jgi:MoaA/NifB/PqqE/SkfB family radical SAM enzyme
MTDDIQQIINEILSEEYKTDNFKPKRKGFCVAPFRNAEFLVNGEVWQCCSGYWVEELKKWQNAWIQSGPAGNVLNEKNWEKIWNSEIAIKLRQSMHDGDFKYCDENECGFLHRWWNENIDESVYNNGYFPIYDDTTIHKLWNAKEINPDGEEKWKEIYFNKLTELKWDPETVIFSHDRSCNLSCPSCRNEFIQYEGEEKKQSEKIQNYILKKTMKDAHELYITASGDPFGGKNWRNLLKSITIEKYPQVKTLHLHTNGNGWTEELWNKLSNLHKIPRIAAEISIDASTKETYEVIRRGGIWERLQKNLHFIFTKIPNLDFVRMTFVVQNNNYKEMVSFIEMSDYFQKLNGMRTEVNFIHINNWGTFSDEEFELKKIWSSSHFDYLDFKNEVKTVKECRKKYKNLEIYTNF